MKGEEAFSLTPMPSPLVGEGMGVRGGGISYRLKCEGLLLEHYGEQPVGV